MCIIYMYIYIHREALQYTELRKKEHMRNATIFKCIRSTLALNLYGAARTCTIYIYIYKYINIYIYILIYTERRQFNIHGAANTLISMEWPTDQRS